MMDVVKKCRKQYLCPMCVKQGLKHRICAYQLNVEEGVWLCESEECSWPACSEDLRIFKRDALTCDWTEDPENAPTEYACSLTKLSLSTSHVIPTQRESLKESKDTVSAESLPQLPAFLETDQKSFLETGHKNKFAGPRDSDDSPKSGVFHLKDTVILKKEIEEEPQVTTITKDESMGIACSQNKLSDLQNADSATLSSSSNKHCDNQVAKDLNVRPDLYVHRNITQDRNEVIDNTWIDLDLIGQTSDLMSNEYTKGGEQDKTGEVEMNDAANSSENNMPTTNLDTH